MLELHIETKSHKICDRAWGVVLPIDLITLTEGDLHDIGETVHDVTSEALQEFMQEH